MKPLLAYAVTENDDNTGAIYFARHDIVARKAGANDWAGGELSYVTCRRAPWADWCADSGIVHASLMIDHGRHFECHGCGATIDEDFLAEEGLTTDDVIGTQHGRIFCCARCKAGFDNVEAEKERVGSEFLDQMRDIIRRRFGDVVFTDGEYTKPHVYVIEQDGAFSIGQAVVSFEFPGMAIGPANLRYDWPYSFAWDGIGPVKPHYTHCNGDLEAFNAFVEATRHAR